MSTWETIRVKRFSFNSIFAEAYNIISSFRATGVFPLDRTKVLDKLSAQQPSQTDNRDATIDMYVPLLTNLKSTSRVSTTTGTFTKEELSTFENCPRLKKSSCLKQRLGYCKWNHPQDDITSHKASTPSKSHTMSAISKPHTTIQHMFKVPPALALPKTTLPKSNFSMTSGDNLKRNGLIK